MKVVLVLMALVASSISAWAAPHVAFFDLPGAIVVGEAGRVTGALSAGTGGPTGSVVASLGRRVDLAMAASASSLFDPELRLLVVRDLLPLNVLLSMGCDRVAFAATLFLGPVHVSFGRRWDSAPTRWATVEHAFSQRGTIVLGLDERSNALGAILGVRVFPGRTRLWGLSFLVTRDGIRVTMGGVL